jgi:hypothetical protein
MTNELFIKSSSETRQLEKRQRILYGVISGFIVGTIAALASSFINVLVYLDLPIHTSWPQFLGVWVLWAGAGAVLAGVAAVSSEGWSTILLSAFLMATTILVVNFVQGIDSIFLNMLVLLGLALPFTAILTPVAYIFFWLARRFKKSRILTGRERSKIMIINVLVIILVGLLPGLYSKFNARAEQAVYMVHDMLQEGRQSVPVPLTKTEGFAEHKDQPYTLSQAKSVFSTVGIDVTAHYDDGYQILCTVIMYSGSEPRMNPCKGYLP